MKSPTPPVHPRWPARLLRLTTLFFGLLLMIGIGSHAQTGYAIPTAYTHSGGGNSSNRDGVSSNVPLNEINIHAFRHFSRKFRTISNEAWFKTDQGYTVTFLDHSRLNRVYYGTRGNFLCSVCSYAGTAIDNETGMWINRKFPGYRIDTVTAITDGEKTVYLVTIKSVSSVKTLSVCDGTIEIRSDLINGG
jgi:hypothetical protein